MSLQQSYIALDWVKDALDETLHQVQQKLAEQTQSGLQAAYDGLHQVSGTLHMAQLNDVLMLSDALEKVLREVLDGHLQYFAVQVAINQSLSLLISELKHLQQTKNSRTVLIHGSVDLLGKLLPNAPKQHLVSFVPDLSLLGDQFVPSEGSAQIVAKLTQAYQHFLKLWLSGNASKPTLQGFVRVASLLHDNAQTRQQAALWQIGNVFHQMMERGFLIVARELRPLLTRLERSLILNNADSADYEAQLIGDLLHILDPKQIPDGQIQQLRQLYGMELPEGVGASNRLLDSAHRQMLAARDGLLINRDTATIALREAIRLLNVSGWNSLAAESQAEMQKILQGYSADTDVVAAFTQQLTVLAEKIQQTIDLTSLSSQVAEGNLVKDARHAAVRESRAAIEKIKSALAIYHQSRGDSSTLAIVPELLQMVSGAFTMLNLARVAALLSNTAAAIQNTILLPDYVPHWKQVDLLAELIAAIEYYFDQLAGHYQDDRILDAAEQTLIEFKQPHAQPEPIAAGGAKLYHDETTLSVIDEVEHPHEIVATQDHDEEHIDPAYSTEELEAVVPTLDQPVVAASAPVAVVTAPLESAVVSNSNPFNDDFEQDEEIRDIFIEEAHEVLENIAVYYPKWKGNFADEASLKEIRRAFHTLKGSGRMVGARTVGELAWSIESLFNRVLDRSISATTETTQLVDAVIVAIPQLVDNYTLKQYSSPDMLQHIETWVATSNALQHPNKQPVAQLSNAAPAAEQANDDFALEDIDSAKDTQAQSVVPAPIAASAPSSPAAIGASLALPLALLSDKAPKELPADDFVSYFGDDDSVREIFLEEVDEVLLHIAEQFPLWAVDFSNIAALKEIRRAFHTLKGSGRMVGAYSLGELAWSIERLFNAVLDKSITANQSMVQLIGDVVSIVPNVVADFSAQRPPQMNLMPIIQVAWLLHDAHPLEQAQIQSALQSAMEGDAPLLTEAEAADAAEAGDDHDTLLQDFESLAASFAEEEGAAQALPAAAVAKPAASVAKAAEPVHVDAAFEALDPQLLEIFVTEVEGYLKDVQNFTATGMAKGTDSVMVNDSLLRALHTLRGSAGMTGIQSIYQIAHVMEHECKRLMREHQPVHDDHLDALIELVKLTQAQVALLKADQVPHLDAAGEAFILRVEQLAPKKLHDAEQASEQVFTGLVTELMDLGIDDVLDAEWTLTEQLDSADALSHIAALDGQMAQLAGAVTSVPIAPLTQLVHALYATYQHIQKTPTLLQPSTDKDDMVAALLAGHIGLTQMFDSLAASQEVQPDAAVIERLVFWQKQAGPSVSVPKPAVAAVPAPVAPSAVAASPAVSNVPSALSYPIDSSNDAELLDIFMEEAEELIQEIDASFSQWAATPEKIEPLKSLQRQLHTLKGGARMACVESLGDYTHELETVYERLVEGRQKSAPVLVRFMRHAQDQVAQQVEHLSSSQQSFYTPTETETLKRFIKSSDFSVLDDYFALLNPKAAVAAEPIAAPVEAVKPTVVAAVATPVAPAPQPVQDDDIGARPALGQMQVLAEAWDEGSAPDPEVLEIFLDEAADIIDQTSVQLAQWLALTTGDGAKKGSKKKETDSKDLLKKLQRNLHTFKGGARMAGVDALGDLAHEMEFVYEDLALEKKSVTPEIGHILNQSHDWLADAVAVLDRGERPQAATQLIEALGLFRKDPALLAASLAAQTIAVPEINKPVKAAVIAKAVVAPVAEIPTTPTNWPEGLPPMEGAFAKRDTLDVGSNEMVRVSANLMDKMINLAGENAINRARIEMELTGVGHIVEDMGTAIQRISEQLRRMDGELESQIIARHQDAVDQAETQYEDFDPLEMDQYSSINQLSKSLAESVSDLLDFKNTLVDKARDSESLLLQQSRIQSELQEGLMSSRLVPFSRLVPRLQRVVRQTATELGKNVELVIQNAEGELDRSVLERMIAPLEHMLRNAVDHGLEMPVDRALQQKPEKGTITLTVQREGGEVIIILQDDGRGINVDAVQRKALERGIIDDSALLTPTEVMQLIFHAGLSTAQTVTQISGRGVGMDVVQSEIRQLGGVVTVDSVIGSGTTFSLRLPLTVAVTDALRVRVGDRIFAVSLAQIERIVRVNPLELEQFYLSSQDLFTFEGKPYRLRYLGEMIGGFNTPTLYGQVLPLPLLIVKYEGQQVAIQVDQLVGSREEMVIKPVGMQLATVSSISGATILGDGSVVVILDLAALARLTVSHRLSHTVQQDLAIEAIETQQKKVIMVVDDSVTVRKVTTRLLERHGYHVIQAKDGVDAMSKLEDFRPDLMLLDIEMPRMDGFEVATLVRHNPRLEELPIIMITSRTGEKHRERAYSIGVNGYMGKPFQEQILLENITELLAESSPA
jgi:chemosensory pili system protein ChpA (sensor histidine kinase/response regulator)